MMSYEINSRDEAREAIKQAGVTCENINEVQLHHLLVCLRKSLKAAPNFEGSMRMVNRNASKFLYCKTNLWSSREAVSFNTDGFIGFCGWADSDNVKPFLRGIEYWLQDLPNLTY